MFLETENIMPGLTAHQGGTRNWTANFLALQKKISYSECRQNCR